MGVARLKYFLIGLVFLTSGCQSYWTKESKPYSLSDPLQNSNQLNNKKNDRFNPLVKKMAKESDSEEDDE